MLSKVNFVIADRKAFLKLNPEVGDINKAELFINSEMAWIYQTYLHLYDFSVSYSNKPKIGFINIIHANDYVNLKNKSKYYCVTVLADKKVYFPSESNIVQNADMLYNKKYTFLYHWPQKNIKKRDITKTFSNRLRVAFFGEKGNSIDLSVFNNNKIEVIQKEDWIDYSDVDCVIAIRDFNKTFPEKPSTKLINSWLGDCLFISANDSAYQQIGFPGFDYIKCTTLSDVKENLQFYSDNREQSELIRANSRLKLEFYNEKSVEACWVRFLVEEHYKFGVWEERPRYYKIISVFLGLVRYNFLRLKRRFFMIMNRY